MLFLSTKSSEEWRGRRFTYDARWSKTDDCREIIASDWRREGQGSIAFCFCEKLKNVRGSLKDWYKGRGRNSKKTIDRLKGEIRMAYNSKDFGSKDVKQMEAELRDAVRLEEAFWRAKSRVQWLNEGDKNTKFFHAQTVQRRQSN